MFGRYGDRRTSANRQAVKYATAAASGAAGYIAGRLGTRALIAATGMKKQAIPYNRKLYKPKPKTGLKKQVRDLSRKMKADQAYHTFKQRGSSTVACAVDEANHIELGSWNLTSIEASLANLRYYDPAAPGTLVTAAAGTGTYNRDVHISSVFHKILCRNNYQVPVEVTIYGCLVKHDTSQTPDTLYTAGVADQVISGDVNSPLLFPFEMTQVSDLWRSGKTMHKILQPGQQMTCRVSSKAFDYQPATADVHNLAFQNKFRGFIWYVRVEGVLGHDQSVATEQTTLQGAVDILQERVVKITYDAGVNLNDFSILQNEDATFTNGGLVSNKPVADNQLFSLS